MLGLQVSAAQFPNVRRNASIAFLKQCLDGIDKTLIDADVFPLSQTVELANLSSMIGNIFSSSIAQHSDGVFQRNGPHKYPDLLSTKENVPHIEIKMALETNKPKGHLAKEGQYLTCRYVLCNGDGKQPVGSRDCVSYNLGTETYRC